MMRITLILLSLSISTLAQTYVCPDGTISDQYCDPETPCNDGSTCTLIKEDLFGCCNVTCKTGMPAGFRPFKSGGSDEKVPISIVLWNQIEDGHRLKDMYKEETSNNTSIICPKPYSFQRSNVLQMPTFFIAGIQYGKRCSTTRCCTNDEYCSYAFNPLDSWTKIARNAKNESIKFCYADLPHPEASIIKVKKVIGYYTCRNHSECPSPSFCHKRFEGLRHIDEQGNMLEVGGVGLCSYKVVCNPKIHVSKVGNLSLKMEYCKEKDECLPESDCVKGYCCKKQDVESWTYFLIKCLAFYVVNNLFVAFVLFASCRYCTT